MPWRSLHATRLVGAVRRLLGGGAVPDGGATGGRGPEAVEWLGPASVAVPVAAGPGATVAAAVRERALAAGVGEAGARELEELWPTLDAATRRQVAAPLHPHGGAEHATWGTEVARQTDRTTCGSAVLVMLAAAGDPSLALWLATGRVLAGHVPPEVRVLRRVRPGALPGTPQRRFAALQLLVKQVSNAPWHWPSSLGTPPWGAAHAARFPGVRFRAEMVDDGDHARTAHQLARTAGVLAAGIPVPLYTGGDLATGLATAVPRHVVLLTAHTDGVFTVYEPGHGLLTTVTRDELLAPRGPHRALGGWTHATWILLPHQ